MSEYVFKTDRPIKNCSECDYRCGLNIIARQNPEGRHEHCPLVELPPHGDLIDRRKLWKDTEGIGEYCYDRDFISLCDAIGDAPIILEASKED